MESIYYVMSWACHRSCRHCYEERFHPYHGAELKAVIAEAQANFPRIISNFPDSMRFRDLTQRDAAGNYRERVGKIILAGGEILLPVVRETVLYPALDLMHEKYRDKGGVKLVIQTTGDTINEAIIEELLKRRVWRISVSGIDSFHEGLETQDAQAALVEKVTAMFESFGMKPTDLTSVYDEHEDETEASYMFFGAQPDSWIGKLWPRGRAFANELSTAEITDNFCNRWSGGVNFLQYRYSGSEVSVEPNGNVYPCCVKTKAPLGSLLAEPLEAILDRLAGNPVYEAISMGHPERMGIAYGWSLDTFLAKSQVTLPSGRVYQNLCVGCDRFHEEVLIPLQLARKQTEPASK